MLAQSQFEFQPDFQPAVEDALRFFKAGLGTNLHSVYVYGSVARHEAVSGQSNLDIVVVTHRPFEDNRTTLLNTIQWRFQRGFPHVKGLNVKLALAKEVASLESIFSWGFLLRQCSECIYGEDLGECFGDYEPSWEIAKFWNDDVAEWVKAYRLKVAKATTAAEQSHAQVMIAKKLLRASYSVVMHKHKRWIDSPVACGDAFLLSHPEKQLEIERLGILLSGRVIPKRSVVGLIDGFGQWLVKEYQRTEFKIG
ncbi:nucleotidyltransferase domain-containing protein [Vibrio agarivorans]|uniref:Nucleotidyltransferase domain-containing protein n=1 Tax=Vibrio agarivorans TaxID=153622 RepID=A0ABT7Y031_9VIBR|nr:nucleotidyltransferase domain-containing protein [Vibrio agarivorans]MDN2481392.1 nucleotidyltransferase domain-containing protein [Vibrio agarivorans]